MVRVDLSFNLSAEAFLAASLFIRASALLGAFALWEPGSKPRRFLWNLPGSLRWRLTGSTGSFVQPQQLAS